MTTDLTKNHYKIHSLQVDLNVWWLAGHERILDTKSKSTGFVDPEVIANDPKWFQTNLLRF
jgi:hypothetical protein